jgi:tungstate transport system substrate-binding protein
MQKIRALGLAAMLLFSLAVVLPAYAKMAKTAKSIILQSTTSTQNSGLFDYILPLFEREAGITVKVVAVGTGQALKNGRRGDGDVLLVHARDAEEKFVAEGYGVSRRDVMYNDFVLVGPGADPAGVAKSKDIVGALKKIAAAMAPFASRGDDSGTNKKELRLWRLSGIDVNKSSGNWYRETGSGMGATLNIARGMKAYTLTDRATWIAFGNKEGMKILSQGDPRLFNPYGVILVNPEKHPHVHVSSGKAFIAWLTGKKGQSAIASYRLDGKQLFFPNAK